MLCAFSLPAQILLEYLTKSRQEAVTRSQGLGESDRNGVIKLLADVKKTSKSKQTASGSHIRYIPPKFIRAMLPPENTPRIETPKKRFATWMCIPYFSLEEYSGFLSAKSPTASPNQTLWQAQYSGNPQTRDMQQVVCQTGNVPPKCCFHISQLWCVVVDNCEFPFCSREYGMDSDSDLHSFLSL